MHDLHDALALPHVQRRNLALRHSPRGGGRERHLHGGEDHLRANGVKVEVAQNPECVQLMRDFIANNPQLWNEDIGV